MQVRHNCLLALSLLLSCFPSAAFGDDEEFIERVKLNRESAEKARIEASLKIKEDADRRARELETRLEEIKKWTTAQFELAERGTIAVPDVTGTLLERWQTVRERKIYRLLQFDERNKGAIESGRALNTLLARVGPAAHQNWQARRLNPSAAPPLHASTATDPVTEEMFRRLTVRDKLAGATDARPGNADPIDVDWPAVLRGDRWKPHREAIEAARHRVLNEQATTSGVSPEADRQLRDSVAALNAGFSKYRAEWHRSDRPNGTVGREYHRLWLGKRHIQKLIASVYFVVDAKTLADLPQRETFGGGDIEQFMSYMTRNNLEFAPPSSDTDRSAYHRVFGMMVRYYLDQNAVVQLQQEFEQQLAEQQSISREAVDVALGKTMSAADQAAVMIEEMKFVRELIDD